MIRMLFCLRRLPALSLDQFQDYWRDTHAPLVARHAPIIGLTLYRQHHRLDDVVLGGLLKGRLTDDPFDGVAELGWHSEADLLGGGDDPAVRAANRELFADEQRFIDLTRSPIFFARTHMVVGRED